MGEYYLDLGQYGEIAVVPVPTQGGLVQAGISQDVRSSIEKALKLPLTGLTKALFASLPEDLPESHYGLDEFLLEFDLGLATEVGQDGGVSGLVAKLMTNGHFKCTYRWKKRYSNEQLSAEEGETAVRGL